TLDVAPGVGAFATAPDAPAATPLPERYSLGRLQLGGGSPWPMLALLFGTAWLLTLAWALRRGLVAPRPPGPVQITAPAVASQQSLRRVLDGGDLGEVLDALAAMARPPAADTAELLQRLQDARQREAVLALQRARWGGGDPVAARSLAREAFARGPHWRDTGSQDPATLLLPPLYPR
ncbi:MAG TPA: protein BatD, partial [Xanthomonadaceae bacterium]|nr:protein BatD [Xanthomonadaceae bacterium]